MLCVLFQVIFSSIIIPKNFVHVTIGMAMLSVAKLGFPLDPKTIQLVLLIFNDKMFALNQSDNITSFNFGPVLYKVASSANNIQSLLIKFSCKSFTNSKKSNGPKTTPRSFY